MIVIPFATAFLASLALSMTYVAMLKVLAVDHFHANNFQLGILVASSSILYVSMSILSSRVAERLPVRLHLASTVFILAAATRAMPHAPSFAALVALYAVCGIAMGLLWAPLESSVSRLSKPGRIRANMGWYNIAWSVGMTIGFFLFAFERGEPATVPMAVTQEVPTRVFPIGAVLLFATGVLVLFLRAPEATAIEHCSTDAVDHRTDRRHRFFLLTAWSGLFVAYVAVGSGRSLFNKLASEVALPDSTIGIIYGIGLMAQTVAMGSMGRFGGWHYRKRVVPLAEIGLAAAALLIAVGHAPIMFALGHIVLGASMAVCYSASLYYSMQHPVDAHRNTAVHEAIIGAAQTTPVALGFIADWFAFTPLSFYVAAALALLLCLIHTVSSRVAHANRMLVAEPPPPIQDGLVEE